jgi:multidrug resistance protein MdtO
VIRALLDALVIMEALPADLPEAVRDELASRLRSCREAIESNAANASQESPAQPAPVVDLNVGQSPAVIALRSALSSLSGSILHPTPRSENPKTLRAPRRLFVIDAFSNPTHWQFALKTTMAAMISYTIYTLLDWPGMRTAIVTCFFVALSSLGETVHKLLLRVSGAVIGGIIAGLSIVFVLPHLTDIGELCLLIGAVSVGAAWVATSSELLSYAGMQIAFAFFLGILQGYAPATDLTVLRDRVAGILLGNIVITIVFSSFWPNTARTSVRAALAEALRAIAEVINRPRNAEDARQRTVRSLVQADHLRTLSLFELRMLPRHARENLSVPSVAAIARLAGAAFVVSTEAISRYTEPGATARLAEWAESAAHNVSGGLPLPPGPAHADSVPAPGLDPDVGRAQRAIQQLELEVQHGASAVH